MIRPTTAAEFVMLEARCPYYKGRWCYMGKAIEIAWEILCRRRSAPQHAKVLELGVYKHPMLIGSDVMDLDINVEPGSAGACVRRDAAATPWPVADKHYDLFIALEVFEHLDADRRGTILPARAGAQRRAFGEVRRIAKNAVLSLPIEWRPQSVVDYVNCHTLLTHEKVLSWFDPIRPRRIVEGNGGSHPRLIYIFEWDQ
jgi:hypothetical protein